MLSRITALLVCLLLLAGAAGAAEIYGQLWVAPNNAPPVAAGVSTSCGGEVQADQYGRYRLVGLPARANCALSVNYQNRSSNPVNIYTAANRNGANFMLQISGGRLLLIRR